MNSKQDFEIEGIVKNFFEVLNANEPEQLAALYAEDGMHITPDNTRIGSAAILDYYRTVAQRRRAPVRANPGPVMIKGDCAAVQITLWGSLQESRCAFFTISENKIAKLITTSPFQSTLVDDS